MNAAPLNLLYLIRTWAVGGSHTIIRLLMNHLPQDRFRIITVPYDAPGHGNQDFVAYLEKAGLAVAPERIPWQNRGNWFQAREAVARLIDKYNIDIVHCHDTHSNVLVGLGRNRFRCACVASPYGWWQPRWHIRAHLYHWIEKNLALPHFDRVYTVSQNMKQKVLEGRTPEDRIRVIHTGLDPAYFDTGASRAAVRADLGISRDTVVIGTVSRLFAEKGHACLLRALQLLLRNSDTSMPSVKLLIVGTGDEHTALDELAIELGLSKQVQFAGYYEDLPGVLRAMDIFVQPSILEEGFPTAVLEAQLAGLPIIASDIGGTKETIASGVTGLLVPPGMPEPLAEALRLLVHDTDRRLAMACAARPWILNSFTLPHMIEQISDLYEEAHSMYRQRV